MNHALDKLTIRGFKSIRELEDFELRNLNVLIGANGAGKSNFISFFKMMQCLMDENNSFFRENGGVRNVLYNGAKTAPKMEFEMVFNDYEYCLTGYPVTHSDVLLEKETSLRKSDNSGSYNGANDVIDKTERERFIGDTLLRWMVYHFHDTGPFAPMRGWEILEDNDYLRPNASNIAPYLYRLREEGGAEYREILRACRVAMPYFKDFLFKEEHYGKANEIRKVNLSWKTKKTDFLMLPSHLSDGSIRFICLVTALMQPNLPSLLVIDEPELGLHPETIRIIGEFITMAAERTQVIIATQSPLLIDQFGIDDIIIVNRKDGQSNFERPNKKDFDVWLEEYAPGELWQKNVIRGGTCDE